MEEGEYGKGGAAKGWAQRGGGVDTAIASGGSGGYNIQYLNVFPGQEFTVVVGKGGEGEGLYGNPAKKVLRTYLGRNQWICNGIL